MANMFEKPIAATPISEFVPINSGVMERAMQRQQDRQDKAELAYDEIESSILNVKALPKDMARSRAIQANIGQALDKIESDANGDYSKVLPQLNSLKRKISRELQYGELGAQNTAYASGMAHLDAQQKMYNAGKSNIDGFNAAKSSVLGHQTTRASNGNWSTFSGESASNIADLQNHFIDKGKQYVAKYKEDGDRYATKNSIINHVKGTIGSEEKKALSQSYQTNKREGETFEDYATRYLENVGSALMFDQQHLAKKARNDDPTQGASKKSAKGTIYTGMQQPWVKGDGTYSGGSSSSVKSLVHKLTGLDTSKGFTDWENTPEADRLISRFEERGKYGEYPKTYAEKVQWLDDNLGVQQTADIATRAATDQELNFLNTKGMAPANPSANAIDEEGNSVEGGVASITQEEGGRISGVVIGSESNYPPGTLVMTGADSRTYFINGLSAQDKVGNDYQQWLIGTAERSTTGSRNGVTITGITSPTGQEAVAPGVYNIKQEKEQGGSDYVTNLYDTSGKLKYIKKTGPNGFPVYYKQ